MKFNVKRLIKKIGVLAIACTIPLLFTTVSSADSTTKSELTSILNRHELEDVIVENGIVLLKGETLDLSKYPNWELSNTNSVEIDENGILTATNEGTVYLSQQIGEKTYIIEVYVAEKLQNSPSTYTSVVDRDYYKVFLDPGHGGDDPGALGSSHRESDLNLQIAKLVEAKLNAKGIQVKMSRTTDTFLSLEERAEASNNYDSDVFVSIHQNAFTDSSVNGIETYYHTDKLYDKSLSDKLQSNLIKETSAKNRGVKSADFGVIRMSEKTAALVECGFITNPIEHSNLGDVNYQDKIATAITNGIEQYLKENVIINSGNGLKPVIKTGVVSGTDTLNIRSGYGTNHPSIGNLYKGENVQIVEENNGWYQILYNQGYGYVSANYITLDKEPVQSFVDIQDHWAKEQIKDFANKGYLNGYGDGTFRPDQSMTRAEFVKLINRVFGFTQGADVPFSDMPSDLWSYNEVSIAVKEGYINGYPDNTFKPDGLITREEAAKIISTITKLTGDGNLSYNDTNEIGDWAKPHVDALTDNGILQGVGDNYFMPQKSMTRAEAVTMLSRIK